jgi:hypothetical protein
MFYKIKNGLRRKSQTIYNKAVREGFEPSVLYPYDSLVPTMLLGYLSDSQLL